MNTYYIHESNIERLRKKMTRIRNKCAKYGCEFFYEEIGEEFQEVEYDGETIVAKYILVQAEGTAIVNGWEFVATLDPSYGEENIIRCAKDIEVPDHFRTAELECEHCHSKRHRKNTYIIHNVETGEFKQVGSSCLCDFTGGLSAEGIAGYIQLFDSLIQGEAPSEGFEVSTYIEIKDILAYAYLYTKHLGYRNSESDYPTKVMVIQAYEYDSRNCNKYTKEEVEEYRNKYHPDYSSDEVIDYVDNCLEYVRNCEEDTTYFNNLKILANAPYIHYRDIGFVTSMVAVYNRHLRDKAYKAKIAEKNKLEAEASEHVGNVKDRITIIPKDIFLVTSWETIYGMTSRYKITGEDNNIYMWDCSTYIEGGRDVVSITGTVKKHDEWNGVKQTWLTRCRVKYKEPDKSEFSSIDDVLAAIEDADILNELQEV